MGIISTQVKKELEDFNAWHSLQQVEGLSLQLEKVSNREIAQERNRWRNYKLQQADLSILVLLHRIQDALILTDDLQLRRAIDSTGRVVVGSVGVLIRGYKVGKITMEMLK